MIEGQLKDSLIRLKEAIASSDASAIRESMAAIEATLTEHRRELDGQLKHYLRNRSYMKALAYLEGETDIPKGRCAGRTDFTR